MKEPIRQLPVTAACAIAFVLSGCSTPGLKAVADFKKADDSGVESDRVFAALVPLPVGENAAPLLAAISAAPELGTALTAAGCQPPVTVERAVAPALVPLLTAAARFAFEAWVTNKKAEVEALLSSAKATYDASVLVKDPVVLATYPCIAILRYGVSGSPTVVNKGMVAVLKLRAVGGAPSGIQAMQLEPTFVRAFNAVAVTAAVDQSKMPVIDLAFAVSAKAIGNQESGLPALLPAGVGSVSVASVEIGEQSKEACQSPPEGKPDDLTAARVCSRSELIPYPISKGPVSFRVGIAEAGKTGIPGARAVAELEALKAAFGPALAEAVKAKLDK